MPDLSGFRAARTAEETDRALAELFSANLSRATGILHPTSTWESPSGQLRVLRINEATPRSPSDAWLLALCRARADAIITTGKILREEANLSHDLVGEDGERLRRWRREILGKTEPPLAVVLTARRPLETGHRLFRGERQPLVYPFPDTGIRGDEEGLRGVLAYLRRRRCATVCVETGPSTSTALYREPLAVDELLLSICREQGLPYRVRGGVFLSREELEGLLGRPAELRIEDPDRRWSFLRFRRDGGDPSS